MREVQREPKAEHFSSCANPTTGVSTRRRPARTSAFEKSTRSDGRPCHPERSEANAERSRSTSCSRTTSLAQKGISSRGARLLCTIAVKSSSRRSLRNFSAPSAV